MYENTVRLVGFVGDISVYEGEGKTPFVRIHLATVKRYKDAQGGMVEKTAWHTLKCFGKLAERAKKTIRKGSHCDVSGRLEYDKWESEAGEKHLTAFIRIENLYSLLRDKKEAVTDETLTPPAKSVAN